jgi:hypothetical protein
MAQPMVLIAVAGVIVTLAVSGWCLWRMAAGHRRSHHPLPPLLSRQPGWQPDIRRQVPDIERRRSPRWPSAGVSATAADRFMINPPSARRYGERRTGRLPDKRPTGTSSGRIEVNRANRRYSADVKETRDDGWRSPALGLAEVMALVAKVLAPVRAYWDVESHPGPDGPVRPGGDPCLGTVAAAGRCGAERCQVGVADRATGGGVRQIPDVAVDEVRLAIRAVLAHTPQHWPGGVYCSNDRSPFPCRMRHWGEQLLLSAGWDQRSIESMVLSVDVGVRPWLAAGAGSRPGFASGPGEPQADAGWSVPPAC